jgi:hypothetical protein
MEPTRMALYEGLPIFKHCSFRQLSTIANEVALPGF